VVTTATLQETRYTVLNRSRTRCLAAKGSTAGVERTRVQATLQPQPDTAGHLTMRGQISVSIAPGGAGLDRARRPSPVGRSAGISCDGDLACERAALKGLASRLLCLGDVAAR